MLKWEDLPVEMQSSEVESYYQLVSKRKGFFDAVHFVYNRLLKIGRAHV